MFRGLLLSLFLGVSTMSLPQTFLTKRFKVGIEYDHSLPMSGGTDRFRHRNNYDPFFVTVTASAKDGYVISYLEVTATVDSPGEVDFCIIRGQTGSRTMVFQLVSNHSDFLTYSYLTYGIRVEEYKKIMNTITIPLPNNGRRTQQESLILFIALCLLGFITL